MIGDKLIIEQHHTDRAAEINDLVAERFQSESRFAVSVARDKFESFVEDVLEREHQIISQHKALADQVVQADFQSIQLQ